VRCEGKKKRKGRQGQGGGSSKEICYLYFAQSHVWQGMLRTSCEGDEREEREERGSDLQSRKSGRRATRKVHWKRGRRRLWLGRFGKRCLTTEQTVLSL
jgi:hypothetical protein